MTNIVVKDASNANVTLKTTTNSGVETPHHNVDTLPAAWDGAAVTAAGAVGAGGSGLIGWLSYIYSVLTTGIKLAVGTNSIGTVGLDAGEQHIGGVSGGLSVYRNTFTRPANTTSYAVGQLVGTTTSVSASNVITMFPVRITNSLACIRRVRLRKQGTSLSNAQFRVHLFRDPPTLTVGDGGAYDSGSGLHASTGIIAYMGYVDVTMTMAFSDGAMGIGTPPVGSEIIYDPSSNTKAIYCVIEARAAYAPSSAEIFGIAFEGFQD